MPDFIPGLKLSELFYSEAAKPILDTFFPQLSYSAALLGWGSEVLGYDYAQSSDHHWGPRFLLFLSPRDHEQRKKGIGHVIFRALCIRAITRVSPRRGILSQHETNLRVFAY